MSPFSRAVNRRFGVICAIAIATILGATFWSMVSSAPAKIAIMPVGDSTCYGYGIIDDSATQPVVGIVAPIGYRGRLQDLLQARRDFAGKFDFIGTFTNRDYPDGLLQAAYAKTYNPANRGTAKYDADATCKSAWKIPDALSAIETNYTADTFNPDIVLLSLGINDYNNGNAPLSERMANLRRLLARIYAWQPNVRVYIATVVNSWGTNYGKSDKYNSNYPNQNYNYELANTEVPYWRSQGKKIEVVDIAAAMLSQGRGKDNPFYSPWDAIHPNARGYQKMAETWNEALTWP